MNQDQYVSLRPGDIVRHKLSSDAYTVAEELLQSVLTMCQVK